MNWRYKKAKRESKVKPVKPHPDIFPVPGAKPLRPGEVMVDGLGVRKIEDWSQRPIYYGVDIPARVGSGDYFDLFDKVGDPIYTNLESPYMIPFDEAVIYRVRIAIMPEENVMVGDILNLIWKGTLAITLDTNQIVGAPLALFPFTLFPGVVQASLTAARELQKRFPPAMAIHGPPTPSGDVMVSLDGDALARLSIPFHALGAPWGDRAGRLSGEVVFRRSFVNSRPVTLYIMLDSFRLRYLRSDPKNVTPEKSDGKAESQS